jgi:hypothetical protein
LHESVHHSTGLVGALSGGIVNWTVDGTYSLETNLHNLGVALAELLTS